METLTQMEISTYDEGKKLLRLITATWPDCDFSTTQAILEDALRHLKAKISREISERERQLYHTAIKDLVAYLDL